jgi:hypothetical protein
LRKFLINNLKEIVSMESNFLMWGERGLVATLFMDLMELSKTDNSVWVKFFNEIIEIEEPLNLNIEKVDIIIEPDFGNAGWGHPDVVISVKIKGQNERKIFFIEAKRVTFGKACENKTKRGENGFNSSLNGQLELNYSFTHALMAWNNNPNTAIEDPDWILTTEYDKDRQGNKRVLKNPHVLEDVIVEYGLKTTTIENYYHIALTTDTTNPLMNLNPVFQPELFDSNGDDCWNKLIKKQIGWFNYDIIAKLIKDANISSLFKKTYELNKPNMSSGDSDKSNLCEGRGVKLIYAKEIDQKTVLHFSWVGDSYKLRDFSKGKTPRPLIKEYPKTGDIEEKITWEKSDIVHESLDKIKYWKEQIDIANKDIK